jgi:hypothetical protein
LAYLDDFDHVFVIQIGQRLFVTGTSPRAISAGQAGRVGWGA